MRGHLKKLVAAATSLVLVLAYTWVPSAGAAPGCGNNTIMNGLWGGVNAALGTNFGCNDTNDLLVADDGSGNNNQNQQQGQDQNQPDTPRNTGTYVALGDSVAAGLGLPAASGGDPACGVSTQAYAARVAASMQLPYRNFACSGATAGDLVTEQHLPDTSRDIEPQLDQAFANGAPTLMTITAGANDIYWQFFVRQCYVGACGSSTDDAVVSGLVHVFDLKLRFALDSISLRSNGNPPTVVLTGYYRPFSTACTRQQSNITATELAWLNSKTAALNRTIANVANDYSFVKYAPVSFAGHEFCTARPWVQGINAAAPFHPTARGQQAIAQAVTAQL